MQLILTLCAFILFLSLLGFYLAVRPFRITSTLVPSDLGVAYQQVSFRTRDNVLIDGWFVKSENPKAKTIIFLHGYPADKGNILPTMVFLRKEYNLFFMDFRYFGKSGGFYSSVGTHEVLDLLAAIHYLHSRGIHEVGVWGFSLGAAVALMTAPHAPEIKAIVADSSYARLDWLANDYYKIPLLRYPLAELTRFWAWLFLKIDVRSVAPAQAVEKLKIPILLIHSEQDNVIPFDHALLLQDALKNNPHVTVIFNKNIQHGQLMENYQGTVKKFFDDHL